MHYIKTIAIGVLCGLAFALVAILLAPLGKADESTYINDLALLDVPITPVTLSLGHGVCSDISHHGVAGVDNEVTLGLSSGVSHSDIAAIIVLAVQELCPSNTPALDAWMAH